MDKGENSGTRNKQYTNTPGRVCICVCETTLSWFPWNVLERDDYWNEADARV